MKQQKLIDIEVDFIGDQTPLTKEEELALNEYFKLKKVKNSKSKIVKKKKIKIKE